MLPVRAGAEGSWRAPEPAGSPALIPERPVRGRPREDSPVTLLRASPGGTGRARDATAIPAWNQNAGDLPMHFGMSGLSAAVGMLELMGNRRSRALEMLGIGAALFECWEGLRIETRPHSGLDPLKYGPSGMLTRAGGVLSGPVPAALRLISLFTGVRNSSSLRKTAAASAIAGSLLTRIAWIYAGHVSARDWKLPLGIH